MKIEQIPTEETLSGEDALKKRKEVFLEETKERVKELREELGTKLKEVEDLLEENDLKSAYEIIKKIKNDDFEEVGIRIGSLEMFEREESEKI